MTDTPAAPDTPGPPATPDDARPPLRPAAFFDLDKTVIATSAATAFARPFLVGGLLSRRAMVRSAGAQIAFLLGSATEGRTERVRAQLSAMVTGWDVERVSAIVAESLHEAIDAVLYAEALDLVAEHHAAGHDVVVVSASSDELVRPIAGLIGADEVIASRMAVADGRYTGEIAFYAYGEAKAEAMRDLARRRGYDLAASSAYTDSATDAPMLAAVGHPFVVNPDRALRRMAAERGWSTVTFRRQVLVRARRRPVRLRQLTGAAGPRAELAAAVALALVVGALAGAWWFRRRPA
ncbi:HAD family hydrolase [Cellulomonas hominis]|uniref:HAD family hydrolase n=1 Tax=Cellulomonas hominis TaxID=156981 RepID=UPI001444922C|nr:HAD family hydrolase [Cellulomonas hominis]NKY12059.1 HAD family hydrolase [Cellulomonas hominis]